jgi:hypothetical protein
MNRTALKITAVVVGLATVLALALFVAPAISGAQTNDSSGSTQPDSTVYLTPPYTAHNNSLGNSMSNMTGNSLENAVQTALKDDEVILLQKALIEKGFTEDFKGNYGVENEDGKEFAVVLTFLGAESKAGIIYLSVETNHTAKAIISDEIGGLPTAIYEIDDKGNLKDYADIDCGSYSRNVNYACTGQSSCDGVIYHAGEGQWCQGSHACVGHQDTHWHDITWCGHYGICEYQRNVGGSAPCGVTWDKCWMDCWNMVWSGLAPGCWPGGGYTGRECHYTIVSCAC